MSVKVIDKIPEFNRKMVIKLEDALKESSKEILKNAQERAPYVSGDLRADVGDERIGKLHRRVSFWREYASFQEFGGDGKRKVRNYSKPDVGKNFLKNAGEAEMPKLHSTIKKHLSRNF